MIQPWNSRAQGLLLTLVALAWLAGGLRAQTEPGKMQAQGMAITPQALQARTLDALRALNLQISAKIKERAKLLELMRTATDAGDTTRAAAITNDVKALDAEVSKLRRQFSSIASEVDIDAFDAAKGREFNLNAELVRVLRPLVEEIKAATESPREIERLKSLLEYQARNRKIAQAARIRLRSMLGQPAHAGWRTEIQNALAEWENRFRELSSEEAVTQQQLARREAARKSFWDSSAAVAREFFGTRGFNLLIGIGAFVGVFLLLRLLRRILSKLRGRSDKTRSFTARVFNVLFGTVVALLSVGATLLSFYVTNDWLLLLLSLVFLLGVGWASLKILPQVFEQLRMLLNLGSVREGERIVRDGVPWKIDKLQLYTQLINPKLTGGLLRIPIKDLIGCHSRPIGSDEIWFPTSRGDWVLFDDGTRAEVIVQSPDLVQMRELGGALHTSRTEDFLAMKPCNLSHGFRISLTFGVDYAHQEISTTEIPAKMEATLQPLVADLVGAENLVKLTIEFKEAAASSLDYQVLADFDGAVARDYDRITRALGRMLVDVCNAQGWTIPFTQITLHQANP